MKKFFLALSLFFFVAALQAQNSWLKKAYFGGGKRERAVGFSIGNKGYVGTGQDTANLMRNDFWEYDPVGDTWTQKASLPGMARRDAISFSTPTKGYVGTGMDNAASYLGNNLNDMWEYDPVGNTWTQKAFYPGNFGTGIYYASSFSIGNRGYVVCGKEGNSNYSDEMWEYNTITNVWVKRANFPGGIRYGMSAFAIGNKGYVGMGADEDVFRDDLWEWDQLTNTWSAKAKFPGTARFNCSGFTINGQGYVCLGTDGGYKDELFMYDPVFNSWTQKTAYDGSARRSAASFVINGKAYVGTGKGVSGCNYSFWEYTPGIQGIGDAKGAHLVKIFPNPLSTTATVQLDPVYMNETVRFELFDMGGRQVRNEVHTGEFNLERGTLAAGTYLFGITSAAGTIATGKILVQ